MTVKDIFQTMDYGLAPEAAGDALAWIVDQGASFGHFINGQFTDPADGFIFVYDSGDKPEVLEPDDTYLQIYEEAPPELARSFSQNEMIFAEEYTDQWGTFRSIFFPVAAAPLAFRMTVYAAGSPPQLESLYCAFKMTAPLGITALASV